MKLFCVCVIFLALFSACGVNSDNAVNETPEGLVISTEFTHEDDDVAAPLRLFEVDMVAMQNTPGSSCFSEIGYDEIFEKLVVTFRKNNATYVYSNVPVFEWESFISSDSLGSYYNEEIKGCYDCERIK